MAVVTDLNRDGLEDLVGAGYGSSDLVALLSRADACPTSVSVMPLLPLEDGLSFRYVITYLGVHDVNRDGRLDVVAFEMNAETAEYFTRQAMAGDGPDLGFEPSVDTNDFTDHLSAADLDDDGLVDLVYSQLLPDPGIYVRRGSRLSPDNFGPPQLIQPGPWGDPIVVGDLDGDGGPDFLSRGVVYRRVSRSPLHFEVLATTAMPRVYEPESRVIDLDGDGRRDVVLVDHDGVVLVRGR